MPGITICTANLDFAKKRRQHLLYLQHLITVCDVLLVQEAKRIRLKRLLPSTWRTMQRIGNASRRGSAVSWRKPMPHSGIRLRLGALPVARTGVRVRVARMWPRWVAVVDTTLDGHLLTLISAHWPPLRYSWLWPQMDRRVVAVIIEKVAAGHAVLVGADFNHLPAKVVERLNKLLAPHGIKLVAHGDGRIDGFASIGLHVTEVKTDHTGTRNRWTDHPAVLAHLTIAKEHQ